MSPVDIGGHVVFLLEVSNSPDVLITSEDEVRNSNIGKLPVGRRFSYT